MIYYIIPVRFYLCKGGEKFGIEIRYVYLTDGTEIDDDDVFMSLEEGTVLHLETCPASSSVGSSIFSDP